MKPKCLANRTVSENWRSSVVYQESLGRHSSAAWFCLKPFGSLSPVFSLPIKLSWSLVDSSIGRTFSDSKDAPLSLITIWSANQESFLNLISSCEISHASGLHQGMYRQISLLMILWVENHLAVSRLCLNLRKVRTRSQNTKHLSMYHSHWEHNPALGYY